MNDEQVNTDCCVYDGSDVVIVGGNDGGRRISTILGDLRVQQQLTTKETPLFLQRMELNNIRRQQYYNIQTHLPVQFLSFLAKCCSVAVSPAHIHIKQS